MAHEIETTAWTNETPWHGLGHKVPQNITTREMMDAAQLDWQVTKEEMRTRHGKVPGFFALTRSSDHKVLDVVGPEYTPVQNEQAFEFFRGFVEAGKATMETAGSLKGGKMVWVLANLNKSFKLAGKDEVKGYLLIAQPHQQGKAMTIQFTNIRVVCNNTLTAALRSGSAAGLVRRAHRGEFDDVARESAKNTLGIARDQMAEFAEFALKLSQTKVDQLQAAQILAQVFGDKDLENEESLQLIKDDAGKALSCSLQALEHAPGATLPSALGTGWGILNAVTYTTDHLLRKSTDSRLYNAWFGKSRLIKQKAVDILANL